MGTCYSLIRRDTLTCYELGKAWFLHHVFAPGIVANNGDPMVVTAAELDDLVSLMVAASKGDLDDGMPDMTLHRAAGTYEDPYWRAVALDIIDWAEGKPFEFHSENSTLAEELAMDAWDREPPLVRLWETGDRHNHPDREDEHSPRVTLAKRRASDHDFRAGNVWKNPRTGAEIVQASAIPPRLSELLSATFL